MCSKGRVDASPEKVGEADIVGHSWFFERELLTAFWRELPDPKFDRAGEDIHFSYMLQKYLGLAALTLYRNSYLNMNSLDPFE
jgi:hypothetical protein